MVSGRSPGLTTCHSGMGVKPPCCEVREKNVREDCVAPEFTRWISHLLDLRRMISPVLRTKFSPRPKKTGTRVAHVAVA